VATGDQEGTYELPSRGGGYVFFQLSPDGRTVFVAQHDPVDPQLRAYDAETGWERFHRGHRSTVIAVAVSPDGRLLASGGIDHSVRLWNLAGWRPGEPSPPVRVLEGHTNEMWSVAFSPDGKLLASGGNEGVIRLWDVASGRKVRDLTGHSPACAYLTFSPDGRTIAAGGKEGTVNRWDVDTGRPKEPWQCHTDPVRPVAYSPDGRLLASGGKDATVQLLDAATGQRVHTFWGNTFFTNVAFSPDGRTLAAVNECPDATLRLWDLETKTERALTGHTGHILGLSFHPGGKLVATASWDGTVRLWDVTPESQAVRTFDFRSARLAYCATFTPEGRYLIAGLDDGTIAILRVPALPAGSTGTAREGPAWKPPPPLTQKELDALPSSLDGRKRADIPPDLLTLAGGGDPEKAATELVAVLAPGPFRLPCWAESHEPALSPDGNWLAAVCGKDVAVFDAATGTLRRTLTGATQRLHHIAFAPDGKRLGGACSDGRAYIWETESGKLELTLEGHPKIVHDIAFSPDGKRIATCCADGSLFLWDADGKNRTTLPKQPNQLHGLAFSPDSKTLAFSGDDDVVVLWDTATGAVVRSLKGHTAPRILNVRFSPDGTTLASAGERETILWDLEAGQPRHILPANGCGLLAFTSDGKSLLTGGCLEEPSGGYLLSRWDPATGERRAEVPLGPHRREVQLLRLYTANADGTIVYACHHGGDDRVSVFDAVTGKERLPASSFHAGPLWALAISPDGHTLATAGDDRTVRLWDLAAWKAGEPLPPCRILEGHTSTVHPLAFSPDGRFLASGDGNGMVILWDALTGQKLRDPFGKVGINTCSFAFSPDSKTVACPQQDGSVVLYDTGGAGPVSWHWHKAPARATAFSPDGTLVASAGEDGTVVVVERGSGNRVHVFEVGTLGLNVAFSRDGRTLAATTGDAGRLWTWDLADGKKSTTLAGHTGHVEGLALHPAGRLAATGSWDGTVRVWDLPTGRSRVFDRGRGTAGRVNAVAFTPEGRYLAATSQGGIVCIWKMPEFPPPEEGAPTKAGEGW
jgi:WD40 repeat protein